MASVAGFFQSFFENHRERAAEAQAREQARLNDAFSRVPVFPNEDIHMFVKRIDNTGVVRTADPKARRIAWKLIGSSVTVAVALVAVLMPGAYNLMAGYQIQNLKLEAQRLAAEEASLELQEAQLLSPARMEELAKMQQFIDPPSQKVIYLDNRGGSLAMNQK
ncbi:MAG TPA: hypothetical protein VKS01_02730 [Bryobacteraceae bacterium]|nr:hypothetical protein [Bryobacteraceae bacterium]